MKEGGERLDRGAGGDMLKGILPRLGGSAFDVLD